MECPACENLLEVSVQKILHSKRGWKCNCCNEELRITESQPVKYSPSYHTIKVVRYDTLNTNKTATS